MAGCTAPPPPLSARATSTGPCGIPVDRFLSEIRVSRGTAAIAIGRCEIERAGEHLYVLDGSRTVYAEKEAGATRAYDPSFSTPIGNVSVGLTAAEALRRLAVAGYREVSCQVFGEMVQCRVARDAVVGCAPDRVYFEVARRPDDPKDEIPDPRAFVRDREVTAIVLEMPC